MAKEKFLACQVIENVNGDREWHGKGQIVFVITKNGAGHEKRMVPPFLALSPCPYCGAVEDKNHNALLHVDTRFGVKV